MYIVILTALGVGAATVIGALLGFLFDDFSRRCSDIVLSFSGGVMLCASMFSLILPSMENGGKYPIIITVIGILSGVLCLIGIDRLIVRLESSGTKSGEKAPDNHREAMLLVLAIAIHNLPEGFAAGVGFGTGSLSEALMIAMGIAIQNLPEGMILIGPLLSVGISPFRSFLIAALTGLVEVVGAFLGYFAISIFSPFLPFSLAFAGGAMIYITIDEIIPKAQNGGKSATLANVIGFLLMLTLSAVIN